MENKNIKTSLQMMESTSENLKILGRQFSDTAIKIVIKIQVNQETGCWEWMGSKNAYGYAIISMDGKPLLAHRISYETFCGGDIKGKCVCHTCDNTICVNPEHLFAGSIADNNKDRVEKGRTSKKGRPKGVYNKYCMRGHRMTESNTKVYESGGKTIRICVKCQKMRNKNLRDGIKLRGKV
jgi:hypothetical protein